MMKFTCEAIWSWTFIGNFLITVQFHVCPYFLFLPGSVLGDCTFLRMCPFYWIWLLVVVSYDPWYFCNVHCNFSFLRKIALQYLLVSAIHQYESSIDVHMSPPSWTSFPTPTPIPHPRWMFWFLKYIFCICYEDHMTFPHYSVNMVNYLDWLWMLNQTCSPRINITCVYVPLLLCVSRFYLLKLC